MKTLSKQFILFAVVALTAILTGCQSSQSAFSSMKPKLIQSWVKTSGKSMEPLIKEGDIVNVTALPFEDLSEGDIVVYESKRGTLISHRIYKCNRHCWFAKGDNNRQRDNELVTRTNYRGLVYVEPQLNYRKTNQIEGREVNTIKRIVYTQSE